MVVFNRALIGRIVLVGLSLIMCNPGGIVLAEEFGKEIYVPDVLSSPGKAVVLQARLMEISEMRRGSLPDKELEFFVQGLSVGSAQTTEDGWARLEFTPKMRGNLLLVVKGTPQAGLPGIQGKGVLLSWERRRPIILVDLAVLVEGKILPDEPGAPIPLQDLMLGDPQTAAPGELEKLAKFYYNLIYLDRTGRGQVDTIQLWLRKHGFPAGMIRVLPQQPTALSDLLKALKSEGWEKVSAGIGQTPDFAQVLVQNRIQTIIVTKQEHSGQFPHRAIILEDWSRIRRYL